jgi:hypothetical protein
MQIQLEIELGKQGRKWQFWKFLSDLGFEPRKSGDEVKHSPPLGQKNSNDFCRCRKTLRREKPSQCDVSAFFQGLSMETPITS